VSQFVFAAHSGFRYMVLLVGAATLVASLLGWRGGPTSGGGRLALRLFRIYVGTLDIQLLLGIATVALRPFHPQYIGHIVMVVLAIGVAHVVGVRLRRAPEAARRPSVVFAGVVFSLGLIVGGILAIGRPIV
jgi:hypothetical protein